MSKNTVTGRVISTKRAGHSNIGLAYAIENPEYRQYTHTFGITRAGRLDGTVEA